MNETQDPPTIVIFRCDRVKRPDIDNITAVFPEHAEGDGTWSCYVRLGQHASCSYDWYRRTRAATPAEYADLLAELKQIGYDNLVIRKRWPVRR